MKFKEMGILPKVTFMGSIAKYGRKRSLCFLLCPCYMEQEILIVFSE